jgi:hypothetical protein
VSFVHKCAAIDPPEFAAEDIIRCKLGAVSDQIVNRPV